MSKLEIPSQSAIRGRVAAVCLVLTALTFAVFGQTLGHGFVNFDDDDYVVGNPVVTRGLTFPGVVWAFTHIHASNWHPLTWLSHMLDCELYGLQPGGHHLTSVLLHTATVIALFLVLWQMTGALWRSAFVAAVFAIHPLRAESVAWVSERKDVLSGFFFMLTLYAYARYAEARMSGCKLQVGGCKSPEKKNVRPSTLRSCPAPPPGPVKPATEDGSTFNLQPWRYYALALFLFALGLMSKPMLVTLPVVLLLLDYWPLRRTGPLRRLALEKLPMLALSGLSGAVTLLAQSRAMKSFEMFPLPTRGLAALLSCRVYLVQMVYPVKLAAFYPLPRDLSVWDGVLAAMVLGVISAFAWRARRARPWLLVGWLWYLVMLAPVVGIVQVGDQAHADRYTYLPQIGLGIAVTWLSADWLARRQTTQTVIGCLMAGVLGMLMVCAWSQTASWKNSESLWRHALACTTSNNVAYLNLGHELFASGRLEEAIAHYQKGLEAEPDNAQFHNNLGNALREEGRGDEALGEYEKAVRLNPAIAEAQFNLGKALSLGGRREEAIGRFEEALRLDPVLLRARLNLGNALLQEGKADQAAAQFQRAVELYPQDAGVHLNLGLCFFQLGKMEAAKTQYEKALQINPADPGIQNNLAWLLATCPRAALRNGSRAVELAQQANATSGGRDQVILHTLAAAFAEAGRFREAVETAERAEGLAAAKSNRALANQLQSELALYRAGKSFPLRKPPAP
jgi:Flp pilus assembly protein TadD